MKYLREFTDKDLETLAETLCNYVVNRETNERISIQGEDVIIMHEIIYGALLSARWNHGSKDAIQGILDFAEYMFNKRFPKYEGYRSIYIPLSILFDREENEIRIDKKKTWRYIYED